MVPQPLHIDGRTGEGGGQLVRMAVAISAITGRAIRVINIRGKRYEDKFTQEGSSSAPRALPNQRGWEKGERASRRSSLCMCRHELTLVFKA